MCGIISSIENSFAEFESSIDLLGPDDLPLEMKSLPA